MSFRLKTIKEHFKAVEIRIFLTQVSIFWKSRFVVLSSSTRFYDGGKDKEMTSLRDKDTPYAAKQEEGDSTKAASSSSRQWSGFKNPRIVRVSRTFGGKDRHSKVSTIKGLRDRRIRLSVPTAIQLYDLQDRLGLSQPSKVIDWLLDTTKHDIDKLPPLPIVPGCNFTPFHQPTHTSQGYGCPQSSSTTLFDANLMQSTKQGININSQIVDVDEDDQSLVEKLKYWDQNAMMRTKQKGVDHDQGASGNHSNASQVSAQNFFPIASGNTSTILPPPSLLNNNNNHNPMSNYYNWEPSNLSLTQFGNHNSNSSPLPSSLSLSSGSQLFLYPSMETTSHFPPHASFINSTTNHHQVENEDRQFNRSHLFNSISSSLHNSTGLGLKPFPLSINHDDENHQEKNDHGS